MFQGRVYVAQWDTMGQRPGDANGPWAEVGSPAPDAGEGARAWTASWVYCGGETVTWDGRRFEALWYSRNQAPGDAHGPWAELGEPVPGAGDDVVSWTATGVYTAGDTVAFEGHT